MFDAEPIEFAVRGERGIDLFLRIEDSGQKRAHFSCIGMIAGEGATATLVDFEPHAGRDPGRLHRLAQRLAAPDLSRPLAFGDTTTWPRAARADDPLSTFLYLEFFRAWQVADMAGHRFEAQLTKDPQSLPREPVRIAGAIAPVFAYNHLSRGMSLAGLIEPVLGHRIAAPGFTDDTPGNIGFALRMLGDMCARAQEHDRALRCFETAISAGDNPFRRRKAIEAAQAADKPQRAQEHIAAFAAKWPLPPDLAALATKASR